MVAGPPEHADEVSAALREIVAEHGPEVLSRPAAMPNLLKDLLPEAPGDLAELYDDVQERIGQVEALLASWFNFPSGDPHSRHARC